MTQSVIISGNYHGALLSHGLIALALYPCYYENYQLIMPDHTVYAVMPQDAVPYILNITYLDTVRIATDMMIAKNGKYYCMVNYIYHRCWHATTTEVS